jgi:hypothetical protein
MCDTGACRRCQQHCPTPAKATTGLWDAVAFVVVGSAQVVWWLAKLVVKVGGPVLVVVGWSAWVWFSGRTWRHHVQHRLLRREVRATGNWAATAIAVLLVWQPLATAVVLAVVGGGLVGSVLVRQQRDRIVRRIAVLAAYRGPGQVEVTAGAPIMGELTAEPEQVISAVEVLDAAELRELVQAEARR